FRNRFLVLDQLRRALPTDLDPAEEIGLRARHREQPLRLERDPLAEDLRVRLEADAGAPPVMDLAELFELVQRLATREALAVELAAAGNLHFERFGQGVDDRDADAMQPA